MLVKIVPSSNAIAAASPQLEGYLSLIKSTAESYNRFSMPIFILLVNNNCYIFRIILIKPYCRQHGSNTLFITAFESGNNILFFSKFKCNYIVLPIGLSVTVHSSYIVM